MTDVQPVLDTRIKGRKGYGLVQLIYGNGKGKTTAALGAAVRCAGSGRRVLIVYFDKGGTTHYNERAVLDQLPAIDYLATGRDRIDPVTNAFDFSIQDVDKTEAWRGLEAVRSALVGDHEGRPYDLVILDEVNSTVSLGMLAEADVLAVLGAKRDNVEVILTGRNPPQSFIDAAHLVTEMRLERHYFYSGVSAREGLDY